MNRLLFIIGLILIFFKTNAQTITEAEYFIDFDPGIGNGTSISLAEIDTLIEVSIEHLVHNLSPGEHILVVRVKDENSNWSLNNYSRFYIEKEYETPMPKNLTEIEYFVDNDPGINNGSKFPIAFENNSFTITNSLKTSNLNPGEHLLITRTKDSAGFWSLNSYSRFFIESYTPTIAESKKIKKVEYFIDGPDPGFHNADSFQIVPDYLVTVSDTLILSSDTTDLGRHAVLARVESEDDEWSLTALGEYDYCSPEGVLGGFEYETDNNIITFIDQSNYAVDYIWDMGNGDSLFATEPIYTYPEGGTYQICQTVYSFCDTTITCKSVNFPTPRITDSIPDFSILEDSAPKLVINNLNNVFADGDGDVLSFYAITNESDVHASISENSLKIEALNDFFGEVQLVVEAQGGGVSAFDTIQVEVLSVNDFPEAKKEFKDLLWDEDSGPRVLSTKLSKDIIDVEDKKLEFSFSSDTSGLMPVFKNDTLEIHLAPNYHSTGNVSIFATDDSLATSEFSFQIELIPLPDAPLLIKQFDDITLYEDSEPFLLTTEIESYFSEPDSQQMSFEIIPSTNDAFIENRNDSIWINISPDFDGEIKTFVTASDGLLTTSDTFNIYILPENDAPKFSLNQSFITCPESELAINLQDIVKDDDGFFDDIQFSLSFLETDQSNITKNNISFEITSDKYLLFKSETPEAGNIMLNLEAKDLQNALNDTIINIKIEGASIYQKGDTLFSSEGSSYQWYKGGLAINGEKTNQYVPIKKDYYQVEITKGNCKTLSAPFQITAIEQQLTSQNVELFPNPVKDICHVSLSGAYRGVIHYQILDINGKLITEKSIPKEVYDINHEINTSSLKEGLYIFLIKNRNNQIIKKLYKSK